MRPVPVRPLAPGPRRRRNERGIAGADRHLVADRGKTRWSRAEMNRVIAGLDDARRARRGEERQGQRVVIPARAGGTRSDLPDELKPGTWTGMKGIPL